MDKKKIYYKVKPKDDGAYCIFEADNLGLSIQDWLDGAEIGDLVLEITTVEMTEEEFEALPEYEG